MLSVSRKRRTRLCCKSPGNGVFPDSPDGGERCARLTRSAAAIGCYPQHTWRTSVAAPPTARPFPRVEHQNPKSQPTFAIQTSNTQPAAWRILMIFSLSLPYTTPLPFREHTVFARHQPPQHRHRQRVPSATPISNHHVGEPGASPRGPGRR